MPPAIDFPKCRQRAFTLVEVLISCAVIALIVVMMAGIADSVRRLTAQTTTKSQTSRESLRAIESISGTLSQATLNTYLDYVDASGNNRFSSGNSSTFTPAAYKRTSELRFLSGGGIAGSAAGSPSRPTHGVFFQAPLGLVSTNATSTYGGLENLLNSVGFYIEFCDDSDTRPDFFASLPNPPATKWRYRLVQAVQPADRLTIYKWTGGNPGLKSTAANGKKWVDETLDFTPNQSTRIVVADNIIALIVLPRLGDADQTAGGFSDSSLAPNYTYDSTSTSSTSALNPSNQLPPLLDITLVLVDEKSYDRFQGSATTPKDLGLGSLFSSVGSIEDSQQPGYAQDLQTLKNTLSANKIDYRIATVTVPINSARWSSSQKD